MMRTVRALHTREILIITTGRIVPKTRRVGEEILRVFFLRLVREETGKCFKDFNVYGIGAREQKLRSTKITETQSSGRLFTPRKDEHVIPGLPRCLRQRKTSDVGNVEQAQYILRSSPSLSSRQCRMKDM